MSRTVLCPRKRANADDPAPLEALRSNDIPVNTGLVQRGKKRRRSKLCCSQRKRWKVEDMERDEEQRAASAWEEEEGQSSSTSPASVSTEEDSPEGVSSEDSSSEEDVSPEDSSSEEGVSSEDSSSEEGVSSEEWSEELDTESDDDVLNDTTLRRVLELLYGGAGLSRERRIRLSVRWHPQRRWATVDGEQREDPLEVVLMSIAGANEDDATDTQRFSVGILDWLELQDEVVVVMERPVPSMDLVDYLLFHVQEILKQLVQAMIDIHSKGVVHRDIKLDNILIQSVPEGLRLWILDFGCGSFLTEDPYSDFGGTEVYSPPEWFDDHAYNAEPFTVWQIGVTLFVLLNGRFPFNNPTDIVSQELYIPWYLSCLSLSLCRLSGSAGMLFGQTATIQTFPGEHPAAPLVHKHLASIRILHV